MAGIPWHNMKKNDFVFLVLYGRHLAGNRKEESKPYIA